MHPVIIIIRIIALK